MQTGHGFGKIILFGEHFVVYNLPAIVSTIHHQSEVIIEKAPDNTYQIFDKHKTFNRKPNPQPLSWKICHKPLEAILKHLNITNKLHITLQGDIPVAHSGLGSSAADCVAFARALSKAYSLHLTDEQINYAAYLGEKEIHGNPSGIDNTAATYGGMFLFQKNKVSKENKIEPIKLKQPIEIVLADSGSGSKTKDVVQDIKILRKQNPEMVKKLFASYKTLIGKAYNALKSYNLELVGKLMNENHKLLQDLTVSNKKLDDMVTIAHNAGALGAKLTGTGRGGLMIALTKNKQSQNAVACTLESRGYSILKTSLG